MTKRQRFVITSLLLSLGFVGIQLLESTFRIPAILVLGLLTIGLFWWSLREGLGRNMTLLVLILPTLFTLGVGFFWFLLPSSVFARVPIVIFYGLGIYALCLTTNIYTVSAIRTIALLRAARGVGFVLSLLTSFLVYDTILSLRTPVFITTPFILLLSYPLFLQGFWAISLERNFSKKLNTLSLVSSVALAQISISLFFWPVTVVVGSLFLTAFVYVLLGLGQARLEGRLFAGTVREYLIVGISVFIGMFLATTWG